MKATNFSTQIGNVTVMYDKNTIHLKDGGVTLRQCLDLDSNLSPTPEELAKMTIKLMWELYFRHGRTSEERVEEFETGTGLSPVNVQRVLARNTRARRSGDAWISVNDGNINLIIAPACSKGSRFPKIENREYDVSSLYRKLEIFFNLSC